MAIGHSTRPDASASAAAAAIEALGPRRLLSAGRRIPSFGTGGTGPDVLFGNAGSDHLSGGGGDDRRFGGPDDANLVTGGPGADAAAKDDKDAYDSIETMLV